MSEHTPSYVAPWGLRLDSRSPMLYLRVWICTLVPPYSDGSMLLAHPAPCVLHMSHKVTVHGLTHEFRQRRGWVTRTWMAAKWCDWTGLSENIVCFELWHSVIESSWLDLEVWKATKCFHTQWCAEGCSIDRKTTSLGAVSTQNTHTNQTVCYPRVLRGGIVRVIADNLTEPLILKCQHTVGAAGNKETREKKGRIKRKSNMTKSSNSSEHKLGSKVLSTTVVNKLHT